MSEINFDKLKQDAIIQLPTLEERLTFEVSSIKMDKDFIWTLALKFNEFVEQIEVLYNIVIFPNPEYFQDSIDSYIRKVEDKHKDPQMSLDVLEQDEYTIEHLTDQVNGVISKWNENIEVIGIVNMAGRLRKYELKSETKDFEFIISPEAVDFWKNRFRKHEKYCICLEKHADLYETHQFKKSYLLNNDFVIEKK